MRIIITHFVGYRYSVNSKRMVVAKLPRLIWKRCVAAKKIVSFITAARKKRQTSLDSPDLSQRGDALPVLPVSATRTIVEATVPTYRLGSLTRRIGLDRRIAGHHWREARDEKCGCEERRETFRLDERRKDGEQHESARAWNEANDWQ